MPRNSVLNLVKAVAACLAVYATGIAMPVFAHNFLGWPNDMRAVSFFLIASAAFYPYVLILAGIAIWLGGRYVGQPLGALVAIGLLWCVDWGMSGATRTAYQSAQEQMAAEKEAFIAGLPESYAHQATICRQRSSSLSYCKTIVESEQRRRASK